jgi:hypothetical protein
VGQSEATASREATACSATSPEAAAPEAALTRSGCQHGLESEERRP